MEKGGNASGKKIKENSKKKQNGPRSIASDPDAFKHPEPKSKLHHSKGKK